jgi:hypothetical protein
MKVCGSTTKDKAREHIITQTPKSIMVIMQMARDMVLVHSTIRVEIGMKVNGKMVLSVALESIIIL